MRAKLPAIFTRIGIRTRISPGLGSSTNSISQNFKWGRLDHYATQAYGPTRLHSLIGATQIYLRNAENLFRRNDTTITQDGDQTKSATVNQYMRQ